MTLHCHPFSLAAVPDEVLSGSALIALPPRHLGLAAMACLKLRRCTDEVIRRIARALNLERFGERGGIREIAKTSQKT